MNIHSANILQLFQQYVASQDAPLSHQYVDQVWSPSCSYQGNNCDYGEVGAPGGGGGGYSGYELVGVCPGTPKGGGGLRCGHSPKMGVLGAGTATKKGGLRCGHNQKRGGLRHVYNQKKGEFRTDLVKREGVAKRGSWELIYILFLLLLDNMIN